MSNINNLSPQRTSQQLPKLSMSLQKASQQILHRIKLGQEIMLKPVPKQINIPFLRSLRSEIKKWDDYNSDLLKRIFSDQSVADKYDSVTLPTTYKSVRDYSTTILSFHRNKILELESLRERLSLYDQMPKATTSLSDETKRFGNSVFLVHGHDEAPRQSVARFLEKLDLKVVILHEQPDGGRTIIEKLEENSSEVDIGYAVVLLTPDDVGATKSDKTNLQPRARQNVVFELGYFIAKLGRKRVRALHAEGVELPSDYHGVLYTPLDAAGAWKLKLAQELVAVGYDIDLNKIVK